MFDVNFRSSTGRFKKTVNILVKLEELFDDYTV